MTTEPRIGHVTDDPAPSWNAGLDGAGSLKELRAFVRGWPTLAPDAIAAARAMKAADWDDWRRGLASERKGEFAGEAWADKFGALLIPRRMLRASALASQFFVPFGVAWIRLRDLNLLDGEPVR
jgi:hypothetical protein